MGFLYNYICVILILIYESSSIEIKRHLCLATAARFINDRNRCSFDIRHADTILRDVAICANECEFWIDHLEYERRFSLDQVRLTIGIEKTFYVCSASRPNVQPLTMYINCSSWNKDIYRAGYRANCVNYNAQCDNLSDNYCVCQCNPGYVIGYGHCVKGNVALNGSCAFLEQCIQPFTVCFRRKCKCINGYSAFNTDKCLEENVTVGHSCSYHSQCTGTKYAGVCNYHRCECQSGYIMIGNNCYPAQPNEVGSSVRNQQDKNIGKILGTLFGGILIGVILTAVIAFLMFQKMRTKIKKREEPIVMFANDAIYSSANAVEREDITSFQANDKKQKVVNVLPYTGSGRGAVNSFVTRKPRIEQPTTEGVYNHLHEQEKHDNDDDDNYDHASAASYLSREPCVYSNMP